MRRTVQRYERFLMPGMLLGGTLVDAIQFKLLSLQTTFTISGVYIVLCAVAMALMATPLREGRGMTRSMQLVAPYIQQFTIGALLSTSFLFYWFSGTFSVSWPIIGAFALLMVSNEVFRKIFVNPSVQVGVLYFVLFSLFATLSAYVFNSLSAWVFVGGGGVSLLLMLGFLKVFWKVDELQSAKSTMLATIGTIFIAMNGAYFLNLIPPIPLSLREAGMYYDVTRQDGEYLLEGEAVSWLEGVMPGQTLHTDAGQPIYAFTSVYAPADLSTIIVHRWERYDGLSEGWTTVDELSFPMAGGRSEGYRGYTRKSSLTEGKWRVTVMTERGQVLGRIPFRVEIAE